LYEGIDDTLASVGAHVFKPFSDTAFLEALNVALGMR
jgi:hypothetical protein